MNSRNIRQSPGLFALPFRRLSILVAVLFLAESARAAPVATLFDAPALCQGLQYETKDSNCAISFQEVTGKTLFVRVSISNLSPRAEVLVFAPTADCPVPTNAPLVWNIRPNGLAVGRSTLVLFGQDRRWAWWDSGDLLPKAKHGQWLAVPSAFPRNFSLPIQRVGFRVNNFSDTPLAAHVDVKNVRCKGGTLLQLPARPAPVTRRTKPLTPELYKARRSKLREQWRASNGGAPWPNECFVAVSNTHFVLAGKPLRFCGANLTQYGPLANDPDDLLARYADLGFRVARVWMCGEFARTRRGAPPPQWALQHGPGNWVEPHLQRFDRLLAEAELRGVKLIVALGNNWNAYGGASVYLQWAGITDRPLPLDKDTHPLHARFFVNEKCRTMYKAWLRYVLTRRNTITGRRYCEEPAVMAWEAMNEPALPGEYQTPSLLRWLAEMNTLIRALAPRQLAGPAFSYYNSTGRRKMLMDTQCAPWSSFCDLHMYALWDADDPRGLWPRIDDFVQLSHYVLRKPALMGEFGFRKTLMPKAGMDRTGWTRATLERFLIEDGGDGALVWLFNPGFIDDWSIDPAVPEDKALLDVLAEFNRRVSSSPRSCSNPALGEQRGRKPLFPRRQTVAPRCVGRFVRSAQGTASVCRLPVESFFSGTWDRVGVYTGRYVHVYGGGYGRFTYAVLCSNEFAGRGRLRVKARMSSEYSGPCPYTDYVSRVTLVWNGAPMGTHSTMYDDGRGGVLEWNFDAEMPEGVSTQFFDWIVDMENPNGLTIYGPSAGQSKEDAPELSAIEVVYDSGGPM